MKEGIYIRSTSVTSIEFRDFLAQLGLTQTEAALLLAVDPRTVRRWADGNGSEIPGPAEHALRAWLGLQRRGVPWKPRDDSAEQIALHREHAIGLYELLLRVEKRGGPSGAWEVDLKRGQATLGPMCVSFYKLSSGGFDPGFYRNSNGRSNVSRDRAFVEDAIACIAKAFAEQNSIKFVFWVTLQSGHVILWDIQKVPTVVMKVSCNVFRRVLCGGTDVADEECRLLIDCNKELLSTLAAKLYAANRFEIRDDNVRVLEPTAADLASLVDRFSLAVLDIKPSWVGMEGGKRRSGRRGGADQ
jgi:hypothetical protein